MKRTPLEVLHLFALAVILCGCAGIFSGISYFDPTTYKNLTDLKVEVLALYDTFTGDSLNTSQIASIRLKLAQVYEYENGKGEKNKETREQVKIIQNIFNDHLNERLSGAKWNQPHLGNQKQIIAQAFDIAIQTEMLKNKNE